MKKKDILYDNRVVKKPWGYEYVVYRNKNNLSVTLLNIKHNHTTYYIANEKKSGFILLKAVLFQLGLWKKRSEVHSSLQKNDS